MPRDHVRVLFIGNSFTARNDVPGLVAALAASRGHRLEHALISAGGASLRAHWNKGEAARRIESERWDAVVLQEQSTLPLKNAWRFHENVRLFDGPVRDAGARLALYATWARAQAPASQDALTDAYLEIGLELGALVVPAGEAWRAALALPAHPVLHDKDGSHPTLAGSYLAACCFLPVLFDESPDGADHVPPGLSASDAALLQRVAAATSSTG